MKKTTFQGTTMLTSIIYDQTYMDYLEADGIKYSKRNIPIFQTLLPKDTLSYNGYEIAFKNEDGAQTYVYAFITEKRDFTKCVTFFPDSKLDNLYLLDLEQALRTGQLVFENAGIDPKQFTGFDFNNEIRIEELLDKTVALSDGGSYAFTTISKFPEGITGKRILPNGDAVPVFLARVSGDELCFIINDSDANWQILNKEQIMTIFGTQK